MREPSGLAAQYTVLWEGLFRQWTRVSNPRPAVICAICS